LGIPIISDVIDGVKWTIDFIFNKAPRPVQFGIFLVLLLLLGALIPFLFHMVGVHCNHDAKIVTTSPLAFITNIKIAFIGKEEGYQNVSAYQPDIISLLPSNIGGESCVKPICYDDSVDVWYWESEGVCDNKTILHPYLSKHFDWQKCVICNGTVNYTVIVETYSAIRDSEWLCYGDAYRIPDSDMSWVQKTFCDPDQRCIPPRNYYYDYDTGLYTCLNPAVCGANITEANQTYLLDEELKQANAEQMYKDEQKTYDKALYFKCDNNLRPQLTFFGIPFLDYKIWLFIMVIAVMFIFLNKIKKHN